MKPENRTPEIASAKGQVKSASAPPTAHGRAEPPADTTGKDTLISSKMCLCFA